MFKKLINRIIFNVMINRGNKALKELDDLSVRNNEYSKELLFKILNDNKDTEYGKKFNFKDVKSLEDYKKLVPFSSYDDYAPYIERVINKGEKDLYTVYPIVSYAQSSGSVGVAYGF